MSLYFYFVLYLVTLIVLESSTGAGWWSEWAESYSGYALKEEPAGFTPGLHVENESGWRQGLTHVPRSMEPP